MKKFANIMYVEHPVIYLIYEIHITMVESTCKKL